MRHFWTLPAVLRVAICAHHSFSVTNDILAYPQYEVIYSESIITLRDAEKRLTSSHQYWQPEDAASDPSSELIRKVPQSASGAIRDFGYGAEENSRHIFERLILRGHPYLCTIPIVQMRPDPMANTTQSPEEQNQDLERASMHGLELLGEMQGQCLYYISGWWTYSFCYNDGVKQYHHLQPPPGVAVFPPVEDENEESYMLGKFLPANGNEGSDAVDDSKAAGTQLQTLGETNYLVQTLNGGTECDLTGRNRRIEVQFHCNPSDTDRIAMIKETAACVYLMVIHTPRLCKDIAFMPPQEEKPAPITCQQIVKEEDISEWRAIKAIQAGKVLFGKDPKLNAHKPVIVGGIEVGGKTLVGKSTDKKIEPGNIVRGQQKAKFLARVATFDGEKLWKISEKELEKLGLEGGLAVVDHWIEKLKTEEPWRLDIVEKPSGREFVVVLGTHLDDDEVQAKDAAVKDASDPLADTTPGDGGGSQEEYKEEL